MTLPTYYIDLKILPGVLTSEQFIALSHAIADTARGHIPAEAFDPANPQVGLDFSALMKEDKK